MIRNGRVIDPESGLDAVRNVGIREGRIESVSVDALEGSTAIDATGLVVAPGFIDLHQHGRVPINEVNYAFKAMDGVTTALELEIGTADVDVRDGAEGVREAVGLAAETGASLHVVHAQTPELLREIREARGRGLDVTTEMYPYTASATLIDSALYRDWEGMSDAEFQTLLWPPTGERLTRETFAKYRKVGGLVIRFGNSEENVRSGLADPMTMIASDGNNTPGEPQHPRTAGTFARILGPYVRDQKLLTLADAVRKMTLMPAKRLEPRVPQLLRKGRVAVGADADITVFDPRTVADRATYERPAQYSVGVRHVLVNGVPVVGKGAAPGRDISRTPSSRAGALTARNAAFTCGAGL